MARTSRRASRRPPLTYELTYIAEWGVVLFLPRASAKLWAIKL